MKKAKKNLLKSGLIALAVLLAVSAVLVFLKTRVQPPRRINYINQYVENIHQASEQPKWAYILCNNPLSYKK